MLKSVFFRAEIYFSSLVATFTIFSCVSTDAEPSGILMNYE